MKGQSILIALGALAFGCAMSATLVVSAKERAPSRSPSEKACLTAEDQCKAGCGTLTPEAKHGCLDDCTDRMHACVDEQNAAAIRAGATSNVVKGVVKTTAGSKMAKTTSAPSKTTKKNP